MIPYLKLFYRSPMSPGSPPPPPPPPSAPLSWSSTAALPWHSHSRKYDCAELCTTTRTLSHHDKEKTREKKSHGIKIRFRCSRYRQANDREKSAQLLSRVTTAVTKFKIFS